MSSRQLRKLQGRRELKEDLEKHTAASDQGEEESEDERVPAARPKANLFAALGGEDDADDDEDDDGGAVIEPVASEPQASTTSKKNKKKKRKKSKRAAAAAAAAAADEDAAAGASEDEIDKAIKALDIADTNKGTSSAPDEAQQQQRRAAASNGLFQISTHHLRAVNEMRSLFGREIIESANAEEERQQQERLRGRGGGALQLDLETFLRTQAPSAKKLPEVSLRRNVFVQGREHWPAASAGGLTMKEVRQSPDGSSTEYAYLHEGEYDGLQTLFFACVQVGDPMRMVHMLARAPYHVSTLLQVSAVAKQDQNMALAAELCERALFSFGRVATSAFRRDLERGRARLDFRRPENRQLWLAGHHYLRSLLRKGTYRTALEWARLLYALDPERDPYAMRHYLHFLAVRAYESKWLLEFLQDVEGSSVHEDFIYVKQSGVLARLQMGDEEAARAALTEGMRRVPWLYCALFQELGLDAPPSIWGVHAASDARQFWVKLYLHFAKDLWNNTQATALLVQVARGRDKVRVGDLPADDAPPGLDATRLVYLEGQTGLIGLAPRALLERQPNYDFDPLPPAEEDNVFTYAGTELPWAERRRTRDPDDAVNNAHDMLERMRNNILAQGGGRGGRPMPGLGAAAGGPLDDESDYDDETDEELRRDLEEHARRSRAPGYLGQLMQMMGLGGGAGRGSGDGDPAAQGGEDDVEGQDDDDVPGAWPGGAR